VIQAQGSTSSRSQERRLLLASAVAVVTVIVVCAMAVSLVIVTRRPAAAPRPVSQAPAFTPTRGKVVFSEHFHDPASNWGTSILEPSGTTFKITTSGYEIVATGFLIHTATSPYRQALQQVGMSLTAKQSADTPAEAGFGVTCRRGTGQSEVRYQLYVGGSSWVVLRRDGPSGPGVEPWVLKEGTSPSTAGPAPITVVGICATLADGVSTRVMMFVDGSRVADLTDTADALPGLGWLTGLVVVSSDKAPSRVTATEFDVRNLDG